MATDAVHLLFSAARCVPECPGRRRRSLASPSATIAIRIARVVREGGRVGQTSRVDWHHHRPRPSTTRRPHRGPLALSRAIGPFVSATCDCLPTPTPTHFRLCVRSALRPMLSYAPSRSPRTNACPESSLLAPRKYPYAPFVLIGAISTIRPRSVVRTCSSTHADMPSLRSARSSKTASCTVPPKPTKSSTDSASRCYTILLPSPGPRS